MSAAPPGDEGHPGHLTKEQDEIVASLKRALGASMETEAGKRLVEMNGGEQCELCRLLRARDWDVPKARTLWEEIIAYRAENKIDTILQRVIGDQKPQDPADISYAPEIKDPAVQKVMSEMPCGRWGCTTSGNALEIWRINQLRPADILNRCTQQEITSFWLFWVESALQANLDGAKHFNKPVRGTVLVCDLKGFGARHLNTAVLKILIGLFGIGQSKYPESLNRVYILNAPTLFSGTWAAIKPVLNARTRRKIIMTNKGMHEDLQKIIPPANLPKFLGGPRDCEIGETKSAGGGRYKTQTVGARSDFRVPVQVPEGGYIGWEFRTEGGKDIKFGVYRFALGTYADKSSLGGGEVVVESAKSGAGSEDVTCTLVGQKAGMYVLHFDNGYSMMSAKTLSYVVDVGQGTDIVTATTPTENRVSGRAIGEHFVTGVETPPATPGVNADTLPGEKFLTP